MVTRLSGRPGAVYWMHQWCYKRSKLQCLYLRNYPFKSFLRLFPILLFHRSMTKWLSNSSLTQDSTLHFLIKKLNWNSEVLLLLVHVSHTCTHTQSEKFKNLQYVKTVSAKKTFLRKKKQFSVWKFFIIYNQSDYFLSFTFCLPACCLCVHGCACRAPHPQQFL